MSLYTCGYTTWVTMIKLCKVLLLQKSRVCEINFNLTQIKLYINHNYMTLRLNKVIFTLVQLALGWPQLPQEEF